jgi:hypothetical protein
VKIADLKSRTDWFELVKDQSHDVRERARTFIAVTERGWDECIRRFAEPDIQLAGHTSVLGIPVRKVTDIADDEIELRTETPRTGTGCSNCGKPVYIHRASQTWACSDPGCRTEGSVEHLGRWWTTQ